MNEIKELIEKLKTIQQSEKKVKSLLETEYIKTIFKNLKRKSAVLSGQKILLSDSEIESAYYSEQFNYLVLTTYSGVDYFVYPRYFDNPDLILEEMNQEIEKRELNKVKKTSEEKELRRQQYLKLKQEFEESQPHE